MAASASGSFFPLLLSHGVALGVALVRRQLAPVVPVQQLVDRGQCHRPAHCGLQFGLDLGHHQDAPVARALQERRQNLALALDAHRLAPPPARTLALPVAHRLAGQEAVAQAAGPDLGQADGLGRLLQAQAERKGQNHRLGLPQLVNTLGAPDHLLRHLQHLGSAERSGHGFLHREV